MTSHSRAVNGPLMGLKNPDQLVVVLTGAGEEQFGLLALQAGAVGFLSRTSTSLRCQGRSQRYGKGGSDLSGDAASTDWAVPGGLQALFGGPPTKPSLGASDAATDQQREDRTASADCRNRRCKRSCTDGRRRLPFRP